MKRKYYATRDILRKVGISRNTLFLWFKHHKIPETQRNRNGHRIFTREDITRILRYKNMVNPAT